MAQSVTVGSDAWVAQYGSLVGKRVKSVRALLPEEYDALGWDESFGDAPVVLTFDDGTIVVPARDPEMNGAGFLFMQESETK